MRRPSFFDDFYSMLDRTGPCGEVTSRVLFLFSGRSKLSCRTMLIQPSEHLNSLFIRLEIMTVLSMMSRSRTVNMQ